MADDLLPLNPGVGGRNEDVETLADPGAPIRQRVQIGGRLRPEVAEVFDHDPTTSDYGLVTRNLPTGTQDTLSARTSNTPGVSRVNAAVMSTTLLAANPARRGALFFNDSDAFLYLKLGTVAATNDFTVRLSPGGYYEIPAPIWNGEIDGIWSAATGAVQVTELT